MEVRQKRYEYFSRQGKKWTEWFNYDGEEYKWQLQNKLRNEYRTIQISCENGATRERLLPSLEPVVRTEAQIKPVEAKTPRRWVNGREIG